MGLFPHDNFGDLVGFSKALVPEFLRRTCGTKERSASTCHPVIGLPHSAACPRVGAASWGNRSNDVSALPVLFNFDNFMGI